jgi:hypothetical protein
MGRSGRSDTAHLDSRLRSDTRERGLLSETSFPHVEKEATARDARHCEYPTKAKNYQTDKKRLDQNLPDCQLVVDLRSQTPEEAVHEQNDKNAVDARIRTMITSEQSTFPRQEIQDTMSLHQSCCKLDGPDQTYLSRMIKFSSG